MFPRKKKVLWKLFAGKIFFCAFFFFFGQHLNFWQTNILIIIVFLKNVLKETCTSFNAKFQSQAKDRESSCQVRRILAILSKNNVKGLRDTIILKEIKSEGVCCKIELK